jgi:TfoX/Sxy family transcriptional regulator of competence genes
MRTQAGTIDHLLDVLSDLPLVSRKMFGEYALYLNAKVVALVCDDQLFIKPTPGARAALPDCPLAPPYPGSSNWIAADAALDDPDQAVAALRAAEADLPPPKPKKPKKPKAVS